MPTRSISTLDDFPPELWLTDPEKAHRYWRAGHLLRGKPYAPHTLAMYASLFGTFCRWMTERDLRLAGVESSDLSQFLIDARGRADGALALRTKRMYLAEIDRVMNQLIRDGLRVDSPARELIKRLRLSEPLPARQVQLPEKGDAKALREFLIRMTKSPKATARQRRDAACVALIVHCGMTVKELQRLCIADFKLSGNRRSASLHAPGHGPLKSRELELDDWVARLLYAWILCRLVSRPAQQCALGDMRVFAAARSNKPLAATTLHGITVETCRACGVSAGPQVLRNEFVANLLRAEVSSKRAAELAGLVVLNQIWQIGSAMRELDSAVDA